MFQNLPSGKPREERYCSNYGQLGRLEGPGPLAETGCLAQDTAGRKWTYWVLTAHQVAILVFLLRMLSLDYIPQSPLRLGVANKR